MLDDRSEPDARQTDEPSGELGVEQSRRAQTDLRQAGQILGCRMQNPLDAVDRVGDGQEVRAGDGVNQPGARALASDLDEIGPLAIAVAGRSLGVDGHGTGPVGEAPGGLEESTLVHDHVRDAAGWHAQSHQNRSIVRVRQGSAVLVWQWGVVLVWQWGVVLVGQWGALHVVTCEVGILPDGASCGVGWVGGLAGSGGHGVNLFDAWARTLGRERLAPFSGVVLAAPRRPPAAAAVRRSCTAARTRP